jgi:hypothetical protein
MNRETATLSIEERSFTEIGVNVTGAETEVFGAGPLVCTMTNGMMCLNGAIIVCHDVEGSISPLAARVEGIDVVVMQLDIAHPHQQLRVAGSFALSIDDFAQLHQRMGHVLQLARFEASERADRI